MDYHYPVPPESQNIEKAPRELLEEMQNAGLRSLIRRTWEHAPFYRERWRREGLKPEEIRELKDLSKLLFIR